MTKYLDLIGTGKNARSSTKIQLLGGRGIHTDNRETETAKS